MPLLVRAGFSGVAQAAQVGRDSAKAESGYSKPNVAKDVHELVHHLGHQEIKLVGTDIGTMVACAYAASYQAEVRRLVLSESVLPGFDLEELMNPATGGYWHFGFHMQLDVATMLTEGKEAAYLLPTMTMTTMSASPDAADSARNVCLPHYTAPGGMRAGFKHYETLLEDGREPRPSRGQVDHARAGSERRAGLAADTDSHWAGRSKSRPMSRLTWSQTAATPLPRTIPPG